MTDAARANASDLDKHADEFDRVGGPAFPAAWSLPGGTAQCPGMTLRDHFAGQALVEFSSLVSIEVPETFDIVARYSYRMADAMIAARKAGA